MSAVLYRNTVLATLVGDTGQQFGLQNAMPELRLPEVEGARISRVMRRRRFRALPGSYDPFPGGYKGAD